MNTKLLFLSCLVLLLASCRNDSQSPVIIEPVMLSMDSIAEDTTKVLIAELPGWFDSTRVLIHGIGFRNVEDKSLKSRLLSKSSGVDDYYNDSYGFSFNSSADVIYGNIVNLYFDNTETNEQRLLTDKALNITRVHYLRALAKSIGRDYLVYEVYDKDYNGDGSLNGLDITALYISRLDGSVFAKITDDHHAYIDGKLVVMNKRFYFRTYEDVNKNCQYDKGTDRYHYYYIDFSVEPYRVTEYNPLVK